MLRHLKLGWLLVIMALFVAVFAIPASAQSSTPGLNVVSDSSGVTIYLVNSDGTQTQIFYIATITVETVDDTAGQGGGSSSSVASSDVISAGSVIINVEALNVRSGPGVA